MANYIVAEDEIKKIIAKKIFRHCIWECQRLYADKKFKQLRYAFRSFSSRWLRSDYILWWWKQFSYWKISTQREIKWILPFIIMTRESKLKTPYLMPSIARKIDAYEFEEKKKTD